MIVVGLSVWLTSGVRNFGERHCSRRWFLNVASAGSGPRLARRRSSALLVAIAQVVGRVRLSRDIPRSLRSSAQLGCSSAPRLCRLDAVVTMADSKHLIGRLDDQARRSRGPAPQGRSVWGTSWTRGAQATGVTPQRQSPETRHRQACFYPRNCRERPCLSDLHRRDGGMLSLDFVGLTHVCIRMATAATMDSQIRSDVTPSWRHQPSSSSSSHARAIAELGRQ